MFLAINELIKERARFILITLVIILVSYLTFFLTALAYGLATSYTQGIDSWQASGILLQKDANNSIGRSLISKTDYQSINGDTALLGASNATVVADQTKDVALFGVEMNDFLAPKISEGRPIKADNEVVVSDTLKAVGVKLGEELRFQSESLHFTVVGFTEHATFQTAPVVYLTLEQWRAAASELAGMKGMKDLSTINAIVTRGGEDSLNYNHNALSWQSIRDFSFELPGYRAQVLTFSLMIGFLIVIAAFVLAIFMYILTLQKKAIFGVLKAEGVPNFYISRSVKAQILIVSASGMAIGLVLTLLTGWGLGEKVPFLVQSLFFVGIVAIFLLCAAIGGIASVWAVTRIDPVEAIG